MELIEQIQRATRAGYMVVFSGMAPPLTDNLIVTVREEGGGLYTQQAISAEQIDLGKADIPALTIDYMLRELRVTS